MPVQKYHTLFWFWLKITLSAFLLLSAIALLLLVLFTILKVPSFVIGNDTFWLLRWRYEPDASYIIAFNPLFLLIIAAAIGFIGLWLKQKPKRHRRKTR
ncbi:hypothetical protein FNW02_07140 [Komarekiella sp. 'clone 1']|uniref:Uncharacterized protein n=1 Tax=Komarekiella delphini-convector SJRDD-AB1 TaxID=2593771 RepID=A0AA40VPT3_9NOST|nr:hypothetical protein [Komarekiella delphini-convector]MBD6615614.1 hypothetical protein [Komarekiella delphini-convector SJRDD-AB1]